MYFNRNSAISIEINKILDHEANWRRCPHGSVTASHGMTHFEFCSFLTLQHLGIRQNSKMILIIGIDHALVWMCTFVCPFCIYSTIYGLIMTKLGMAGQNLFMDVYGLFMDVYVYGLLWMIIRWQSVCMLESQGGNPLGKVLDTSIANMTLWLVIRLNIKMSWNRWNQLKNSSPVHRVELIFNCNCTRLLLNFCQASFYKARNSLIHSGN